jgi:hypothetical protein
MIDEVVFANQTEHEPLAALVSGVWAALITESKAARDGVCGNESVIVDALGRLGDK